MATTDSRLILSTDYELFFHRSGSVPKCLLEPGDRLLEFTARHGMQMTIFVDAGMLRCFDRHASEYRELAADVRAVREQLQRISAAGHELGLHVHPHWEDTRLVDGAWDFSDTRYRLDRFSDDEVADIFASNFALLQELSDAPVVSYRAGGFCIEPFDRIAPHLERLGVTIDSSVVPGARLNDAAKGFDFSRLPDTAHWDFEDSPSRPATGGRFCEVAITPLRVGRFFFWGRLVDRLSGGQRGQQDGDGLAKALGKPEILRRLLGQSRVSELSMDDAKAPLLGHALATDPSRRTWHVMGHPKLLSERSLDHLAAFVDAAGIAATQSVAAFAETVGRPSPV